MGKLDEKYKAPQYSIAMEYIFNPFYEFVHKFYPSWWSPNGITLFGIGCTVIASILFFTDAMYPVTNDPATGLPRSNAGFNFLYDLRPTSNDVWRASHGGSVNKKASASNASAETKKMMMELPVMLTNPRKLPENSFVDVTSTNQWVFIVCGLLNYIYIIADNTDGKHARRFKRSSLIGEYLDHGLDMLTALLSAFIVACSGGERISIGFAIQVGSALMMVLCHFHHYDTGEFIWGDRAMSVDEAMVLISSVPFISGVWPGFQSATIPGTDIRVISLLVCLFLFSIVPNILRFIVRNPRTLNSLFVAVVCVLASMVGWAVFHDGGMSPDVQADIKMTQSVLAPYLAWSSDFDVSNVFSFPDEKGAPSVVKKLYSTILMLCPPYLLRVIGSRIVKLLTCYPALWCITLSCAVSTIAHIPIAAHCMREKVLSYVPLAGVMLSVYTFGVSPAGGMLIGVGWHLGQVVMNCHRLQSRKQVN